MIADAMAPAGQAYALADMVFAKRAAGMGAVAVHKSLKICGQC
jgi:hypothetical protein